MKNNIMVEQYPTRLHVALSLVCAAGVLLYLVCAAFLGSRYNAFGILMVFGGVCALCLAETRFLLMHRRGASLINSHVSEEKSPVSFKLHVVLQIFFAAFSGLAFIIGLWALPK